MTARPTRWILTTAIVLGCSIALSEGPARPNVLLIVSEDHGPNLGCYGDPVARTPSLDRLAAEGVRFTRAYVTQPGCSQSRSSILTGLYPHQNGQIGLATHKYAMYRNDTPNIPTLLKRAGYRTGIIGKLHINPESAFTFDFKWNDPKVISFGKRDVPKIAEVAGRFMARSDGPFFLSVNYPDAHTPHLRRQKGLPDKPVRADDVKPLGWLPVDTPNARKHLANYYSCIARLDAGVGMLLEQLHQTGKARDTIVIFLSDHGAQFSRGKMTCYESGLRIPLIVRWPGTAKRSLASGKLVSTIDLMPTILDAAGAASPKGLPGMSLVPLLAGKSADWREYLFAEYAVHFPPMYFPERSVRDDRYKLIVNLLTDRPNPVADKYLEYGRDVTRASIAGADPSFRRAWKTFAQPPAVELYDLQNDPYEMHNLADGPEHAQTVARLREKLTAWQKRTNDPLADAAKLKKLTQEHDTLKADYRKDPEFKWQYPIYLQ